MKKDLIIGCITGYNYEKIRPWVISLGKSDFTGDKAMIVYNIDYATVHELKKNGFLIWGFNKSDEQQKFFYKDKFSIVVERFFHLWLFLGKINLENYRYIISTDVKDAVFQTNPSEWLENNIGDKKINVGCESLKYKDEVWGNNNMLESFGAVIQNYMKEIPIYNAGTIAGEAAVMRDFFLNIYLLSVNNPISNPDQAAMNVLLSLEPYKSVTKFNTSEDGWACQAGTIVDPSKINAYRPHLLDPEPIYDGNYVYTSAGKKFCIVHQYDRVPAWKGRLESMYAEQSTLVSTEV